MKKGVSTFIAFALTILFITAAVILVMAIVAPTLEKTKASGVVMEAFSNLGQIDSRIKEVTSEGQGSKRTLSLTVSGGDYRVDKNKEWIYFEFEPNTDLGLGGERGNIKIENGLLFLDFFNQYPEGSNATSAWTPQGSTSWYVINGAYESIGDDTGYSQINGLAFGDGTFEAKFKISDSNGIAYFAFRGTDSSNKYLVTVNMGNSQISLSAYSNQLGSAAVQLNTNMWYTLRIEAHGSSIKVYLDGIPQISVMDNTYVTGIYNALGTYHADNGIFFDDVKITTGGKNLKLIIPYSNIDLNGTDRFSTGNYQMEIENMGINTTTNKPIINIEMV